MKTQSPDALLNYLSLKRRFSLKIGVYFSDFHAILLKFHLLRCLWFLSISIFAIDIERKTVTLKMIQHCSLPFPVSRHRQ